MRLGQASGARVGADVAVHIEEAERSRVGLGVPAGEPEHELVAESALGQVAQAAADGLDLGRPVQCQDATQVGGCDAGGALGAGLAQQGQEGQGQQQRAEAVEATAQAAVDLLGDVHQTHLGQRRQDQEQTHHRQLATLGDDRGGLRQQADARRLPFGQPGRWQRNRRQLVHRRFARWDLDAGGRAGSRDGWSSGQPSQDAADGGNAELSAGGDLAQAQALGFQPLDLLGHLGGQLVRAPRTAPFR